MNKVILTLVALIGFASSSVALAASTYIANLSSDDVTALSYTASQYDFTLGNDSQLNFQNDINTVFNLNSSNIWTEASKYDKDAGADGNGLTVTADEGWTSGAWSFIGELSTPFVIVIKASNAFSAYLFENIPSLTNVSGSFEVAFVKGENTPSLSHMTLYTTSNAPSVIIPPVPVPAALWLFAPALIGMLGFRRRKNA